MKSEDNSPIPTETLMHNKPNWMAERDAVLSPFVDNASPGDYWHECFAPICVVISCTNTHIVFCDNVVQVNEDRWTWGLEELKTLPKELFFQKVKYSRCIPKCHVWAADAVIGKPKP